MFERLQQRLERLHANPIFEWTTIVIILVSSFSIGAKSYSLSPVAQKVFQALDWLITLFFLFEILIRICSAGGIIRFFRGGGWNIFDFTIVAVSLIPVNESEHALLARLLRLFRVMRLIYFVPQLRILIGALIKAIPRIGYVALMMFVIFYFYGIIGNLLFGDINPVLWGNVGVAMLTLFRVSTFEDWTDVMYETMEVYPLSWLFYLSFIFLSAFVFLNMMIGVIIETLNEEHEQEMASLDQERLQSEKARQQLLERIEKRLIALEERLNRPPPP